MANCSVERRQSLFVLAFPLVSQAFERRNFTQFDLKNIDVSGLLRSA
jgi:peptidoglycan biosynthesis protein MviN/MurJ (putative lipid II flippase)